MGVLARLSLPGGTAVRLAQGVTFLYVLGRVLAADPDRDLSDLLSAAVIGGIYAVMAGWVAAGALGVWLVIATAAKGKDTLQYLTSGRAALDLTRRRE